MRDVLLCVLESSAYKIIIGMDQLRRVGGIVDVNRKKLLVDERATGKNHGFSLSLVEKPKVM